MTSSRYSNSSQKALAKLGIMNLSDSEDEENSFETNINLSLPPPDISTTINKITNLPPTDIFTTNNLTIINKEVDNCTIIAKNSNQNQNNINHNNKSSSISENNSSNRDTAIMANNNYNSSGREGYSNTNIYNNNNNRGNRDGNNIFNNNTRGRGGFHGDNNNIMNGLQNRGGNRGGNSGYNSRDRGGGSFNNNNNNHHDYKNGTTQLDDIGRRDNNNNNNNDTKFKNDNSLNNNYRNRENSNNREIGNYNNSNRNNREMDNNGRNNEIMPEIINHSVVKNSAQSLAPHNEINNIVNGGNNRDKWSYDKRSMNDVLKAVNNKDQDGHNNISNNRGIGNNPSGGTHSVVSRHSNDSSKPDQNIPAAVSHYIPPEIEENEETLFAHYDKGENFDKYEQYAVECTGTDAPKNGINKFSDAKLSETITQNIVKAGYDLPTPIQKWAIPIIQKERDLMACAQTGSGKTAAFLLPIISELVGNQELLQEYTLLQVSGVKAAPLVLIISPTRELAVQIQLEVKKFSYKTMIRSECIYGGVSINHQLNQLNKGCQIIVGTIGRLADFVNRGRLDLSCLRYLVLDEADRMLDLGFHDEVMKLCRPSNIENHTAEGKKFQRQTLLFSATFPTEIQRLAKNILHDYIFLTIGLLGQANQDISQVVLKVDFNKKREKLMEILSENNGKDRVIVFIKTKKGADFLANCISEFLKLPMTSIHGDFTQQEREQALNQFRSGQAIVLMATSVAARGLDIPEVKYVINYDLPESIDEYVHRIGRTARCGNIGKAISFYTDEDFKLARPIIKVLTDAKQTVPDWLEEAAAVSFGEGGFNKDQSNVRDFRRNDAKNGRGRFSREMGGGDNNHGSDMGRDNYRGGYRRSGGSRRDNVTEIEDRGKRQRGEEEKRGENRNRDGGISQTTAPLRSNADVVDDDDEWA